MRFLVVIHVINWSGIQDADNNVYKKTTHAWQQMRLKVGTRIFSSRKFFLIIIFFVVISP